MSLSLGSTVGAEFIGHIIVDILFTLTTIQTYIYFRDYPKDKLFLKIPIAALWVLNAVHFAFICDGIYNALVVNYGNPVESAGFHWSWPAEYLLDSCIEIIVRSIYCVRLWKLVGWNTLVAALISLLTLGNIACSLASSILLFLVRESPNVVSDMNNIGRFAYANFAFIVALDILITSCFCLYLFRNAQRVLRLRTMIHTLILYTVCSTVLTTAIEVPAFVFSLNKHNNFTTIALQMLLPGLYINSLLTWLNRRQRLLNGSSHDSDAQGSGNIVINDVHLNINIPLALQTQVGGIAKLPSINGRVASILGMRRPEVDLSVSSDGRAGSVSDESEPNRIAV